MSFSLGPGPAWALKGWSISDGWDEQHRQLPIEPARHPEEIYLLHLHGPSSTEKEVLWALGLWEGLWVRLKRVILGCSPGWGTLIGAAAFSHEL